MLRAKLNNDRGSIDIVHKFIVSEVLTEGEALINIGFVCLITNF